jgi:hypothetical protein
MNELEPFAGGQSTAAIREITWHHSQECYAVFLVYSRNDLLPKTLPTPISGCVHRAGLLCETDRRDQQQKGK